MITELTSQQEAAISFYQQKWQKISRSTQPINREKVVSILKDVNNFLVGGDPFPEIIFFTSPFAAFDSELEKMIAANFENTTNDEAEGIIYELQFIRDEGLLRGDLYFELEQDCSSSFSSAPVNDSVCKILNDILIDQEGEKRYEAIWNFLEEWLRKELRQNIHSSSHALTYFWWNFMDFDSEWITYPALFDFYINELKCPHDPKQWETYEKVLTECGTWFLPGGRHWIICDRPCKILLDEENNLHAEGEPAIEYSDGFALYVEHGKIQSMVIPSK